MVVRDLIALLDKQPQDAEVEWICDDGRYEVEDVEFNEDNNAVELS